MRPPHATVTAVLAFLALLLLAAPAVAAPHELSPRSCGDCPVEAFCELDDDGVRCVEYADRHDLYRRYVQCGGYQEQCCAGSPNYCNGGLECVTGSNTCES
ncbi:hypothetical protein DFJ74DRAFT_712907 [Hyaloraphidium curvatum]|nr:hypothetical protein DFJ74DRAFT_712907 [Hyaloraphidium curvatum]